MLFHNFKETPIFSSRTPLLRTLNLPPARFPRSHLTSESFVEFSICSYERTDEQSNKRPGTPYTLCARNTLAPRFTDFFTDFEKKKTTVFQSRAAASALLSFLSFYFRVCALLNSAVPTISEP